MDFSEFPSLIDCFAGGSVADASAVEIGHGSASVEPSVPAPGIVIGLNSADAHVSSSPRRRAGKEVVVASGKRTDGARALSSSKGGDPKKRPADGCLSGDAPPPKSCRIAPSFFEAPSEVEAPLVDETASAVEKVSFEPFEYSFDGRASEYGALFKLFRSPGTPGGYAFDDDRRVEWYPEFARHMAIATKYVNLLVVNQSEELGVVKA